MDANKTAEKKTTDQPELIAALKDAGYTIEGFKRLAGGNTLEVRCTPANLKGKDGNFMALEVCAAGNLQADCRVFPAVPKSILILRVELPVQDEDAAPENDTPVEKVED